MNDKQLKAELARLRAENARLRKENAALTQANAVSRLMEELAPLATRAYRQFERDNYEGGQLPDDAAIDNEDEGDCSAMPGIVLRRNLAGIEGGTYSAQFGCFEFDPENDYTPTEYIELALGTPSANPVAALESLREALEQEPDEEGVRLTPDMRDAMAAFDLAHGIVAEGTPSGEKPN